MADEQPETVYVKPQPLFDSIGAEQAPTQIESYCVGCGKSGTTTLLLTKIPHFQEVILLAFECPHCGLKNNEIQSGQSIKPFGTRLECQVKEPKDLNRQIVRSEKATLGIKELDFEIPPSKSQLSTVEGIIDQVVSDLNADQPARAAADYENFQKINEFIDKLKDCLELKTPFTFTVDDPSGNSYLENLHAPEPDPQIAVSRYKRTAEQNVFLGLPEEDTPQEPALTSTLDEILEFATNCNHCNAPLVCRMQQISIPYFKDVIIMASNCEACGARYNEVKAGGPIEPKGKKITLKLVDAEDLSRDILKSESAGMSIPEIALELTSGTLGGRFTTVEGILRQVIDELENRQPFVTGDTATSEGSNKFENFLNKVKGVLSGEIKGTLVLDDPLGSSYLQNLYAPDPDPNMVIEEYERTWEQNEMFGLNDIKTENYTADDNNGNDNDNVDNSS